MAKESNAGGIQWLVIIGNVIILLCGITLTAVTIWVVTDGYKVYPILGMAHNDDVFAGAWIAIFTGMAFFLLGFVGIIAALRMTRKLLLGYIVCMLVVFAFESASCITSFTQRDYLVGDSNFLLKQMLTEYPSDTYPAYTETWNMFMREQKCCGSNGPTDWLSYTSKFSEAHNNDDVNFPWPMHCCVLSKDGPPLNITYCRLGMDGYVNTAGCFDYFSAAVNRYTWGVAWFGFAILCFTFFVLAGAMYLYTVA